MRLPGDYFAPSPKEYTDVTNFVSRLRAQIGKLRPVPASRHAAPFTFIFKVLATASHVFLPHGALRGALQVRTSPQMKFSTGALRPIQSSYRVLRKEPPLNRMKPAYVFNSIHRTRFTTSPSSRRYNTLRSAGTLSGFPGVQRSQRGVVWRMLQASSPS